MAKKVRATLDSGSGALVLEGEDLQPEAIQDAVRALYPDLEEFDHRLRFVEVEYDDGSKRYPFKEWRGSARAVDNTAYL